MKGKLKGIRETRKRWATTSTTIDSKLFLFLFFKVQRREIPTASYSRVSTYLAHVLPMHYWYTRHFLSTQRVPRGIVSFYPPKSGEQRRSILPSSFEIVQRSSLRTFHPRHARLEIEREKKWRKWEVAAIFRLTESRVFARDASTIIVRRKIKHF